MSKIGDPAKLTIFVGIAAVVISFIIGVVLLMQGYNHRVATADSDSYVKTEEFISFLTQTEVICAKETNEQARQRCKDNYNSLMNHAALNNLTAQETVAKATRMLMWTSITQAIAGMLTVAFLIWTVGQAYGILSEARHTTEAANRSADAAEKSADATRDEVRPILAPNVTYEQQAQPLVDGDLPDPNATFPYEYPVKWIVTLKNFGKTPAVKFNAEYAVFNEGDSEEKLEFQALDFEVDAIYPTAPNKPQGESATIWFTEDQIEISGCVVRIKFFDIYGAFTDEKIRIGAGRLKTTSVDTDIITYWKANMAKEQRKG